MGSYYKQQLNEWKSTLDVKAKTVIDIGGAQDPIKGKTKSWEVENYYIVDLEVPHVLTQAPDFAQDMNEPLSFNLKGDVIFCLGVSDYIINPNIFMQNIKGMMHDTSIAWVEFPFFYATHNPIDDEGCRYSEGCIKRLAKQANLEIVETVRKMERSGGLVRWFQDEGQRMAREYEYHGVTGFIVRFSK